MKKWILDHFEEMTEEEVAAIESAIQEQIAAEAKRPLTMEEVVRLTIAKTINSITIEGETALRMVEYYPEPDAASYAAGDRIQYNGKLYKCLQAHTAQIGWEPENAASLWTEICESHAGTKYDPIPYDGNMALENGKYYSQSGKTYLCSRDTVNPVYNALSELVGLYVMEV